MTKGPFFVREEPVADLVLFSRALSELCRRSGQAKTKLLKSLEAALWAECVGCGSRLSAGELIALADAKADGLPEGLIRLQQGCCARENCDCLRYRVVFERHANLDWASLLSLLRKIQENQARELAAAGSAAQAAQRAKHWRKFFRLAALIVVGLLLLLVRQCYLGGRIPLLREPEKFHVDPLPPGQHE